MNKVHVQKLLLFVLESCPFIPQKAFIPWEKRWGGGGHKRNVPERMTVKVMVSHIAPIAIERDPIAELQ